MHAHLDDAPVRREAKRDLGDSLRAVPARGVGIPRCGLRAAARHPARRDARGAAETHVASAGRLDTGRRRACGRSGRRARRLRSARRLHFVGPRRANGRRRGRCARGRCGRAPWRTALARGLRIRRRFRCFGRGRRGRLHARGDGAAARVGLHRLDVHPCDRSRMPRRVFVSRCPDQHEGEARGVQQRRDGQPGGHPARARRRSRLRSADANRKRRGASGHEHADASREATSERAPTTEMRARDVAGARIFSFGHDGSKTLIAKLMKSRKGRTPSRRVAEDVLDEHPAPALHASASERRDPSRISGPRRPGIRRGSGRHGPGSR